MYDPNQQNEETSKEAEDVPDSLTAFENDLNEALERSIDDLEGRDEEA